jgi:hypothetical protein
MQLSQKPCSCNSPLLIFECLVFHCPLKLLQNYINQSNAHLSGFDTVTNDAKMHDTAASSEAQLEVAVQEEVKEA